MFTLLLDNSRLMLSFSNSISRCCLSPEDGNIGYTVGRTRFPISYYCGDSFVEPFTAFFFLVRSTQSTDFGAFHGSPFILHFQLKCSVPCRRYGRFHFISIGSCLSRRLMLVCQCYDWASPGPFKDRCDTQSASCSFQALLDTSFSDGLPVRRRHVVYCHFGQLRSSTRPTRDPLLGSLMLYDITAKLVSCFFLVRSSSRPDNVTFC